MYKTCMPNSIKGLTNTRTSLAASKALQNALYRKSSWFTVESPGIKPDCKGVKISFSRKWLYKKNSFKDFIYVTQQREGTIV